MPKSNFEDVQDFQRKFVPDAIPPEPVILDPDVVIFRSKFMAEELAEFEEAFTMAQHLMRQGELDEEHRRKYLVDMGDALIDLVYVAMGTADLMGLPWQEMWNEVQRANMSKVRADSDEHSRVSTGRAHRLDVIKPEGWRGPDHFTVMHRHIEHIRQSYRVIGTETGRFKTVESNIPQADRE